MKNILIILFVIIIIVLVAGLFVFDLFRAPADPDEPRLVGTFAECVAAGNLVMESYPRQCTTATGKIFVEDIGNELEKDNLIRVESPRPNSVVSSPVTIKGVARGYWYFEASFPVKITDQNGVVLNQKPAQAEGEWMTEEFVPFSVVLEFNTPTTKTGFLILQKDNPSGLPENADELKIPISFGLTGE